MDQEDDLDQYIDKLENKEEKYKIKLAIYDLSKGAMKQFSEILLKKQIDGIWHTSLRIYDKEYYFGSSGKMITTPYIFIKEKELYPTEIIDIGYTNINQERFEVLFHNSISMNEYNMISHNCNHFTQKILTEIFHYNKSIIPEYIMTQHLNFLDSPFFQQFLGMK